jgi:hypothetical protein
VCSVAGDKPHFERKKKEIKKQLRKNHQGFSLSLHLFFSTFDFLLTCLACLEANPICLLVFVVVVELCAESPCLSFFVFVFFGRFFA